MQHERSEPQLVGDIVLAYAQEANETFDALKAEERKHQTLLLANAAFTAVIESEMNLDDLTEKFEVATEEATRAMQRPEAFDLATRNAKPNVEHAQPTSSVELATPETEAPVDPSRSYLTSNEIRSFFVWAGYTEPFANKVHNVLRRERGATLTIAGEQEYTRQTEEQLCSSESVRIIKAGGEEGVDKWSLLYHLHKQWLTSPAPLRNFGKTSVEAIAKYCQHAFTEGEVQEMHQLLHRENKRETASLREQLLENQTVHSEYYVKEASLVTDEAIARNLSNIEDPDAVVTAIANELDEDVANLDKYIEHHVSTAFSGDIIVIPRDSCKDTKKRLGLTPRRFVQMIDDYASSPDDAPASIQEHLQELRHYAATLSEQLLSDGVHTWETPPSTWKWKKRINNSDHGKTRSRPAQTTRPEQEPPDGVHIEINTIDVDELISTATKALRRFFKK